jgi:hypothetical protein
MTFPMRWQLAQAQAGDGGRPLPHAVQRERRTGDRRKREGASPPVVAAGDPIDVGDRRRGDGGVAWTLRLLSSRIC